MRPPPGLPEAVLLRRCLRCSRAATRTGLPPAASAEAAAAAPWPRRMPLCGEEALPRPGAREVVGGKGGTIYRLEAV